MTKSFRSLIAANKGWIRPLLCLGEQLIAGGRARERLLLWLLELHYESVFRRQWKWKCGGEEPHFTDHRVRAFRFNYGDRPDSPAFFYRGFFNSELIRSGDHVLDIGCGDGFFSRRFFATKAELVDAIDIDAAAIAAAKRCNKAINVSYHLMDAVNTQFPGTKYDVVVWDGALGHFPAEAMETVLRKILRCLPPDGVFGGSESLGH